MTELLLSWPPFVAQSVRMIEDEVCLVETKGIILVYYTPSQEGQKASEVEDSQTI